MNQLITVFILILVVAVISGLTFVFISTLKTQAIASSPYETYTALNETGWLNKSSSTSYYLLTHGNVGFRNPVITYVVNVSSNTQIDAANWTLDTTTGKLTNNTLTSEPYTWINITYTYEKINNLNAYNAINGTETSGSNIISYLPLLFLAIIFGVILLVTLRVILPYINLGSQMGGTI